LKALADPKVDLCQVEKDKIKGAVRTDFILSAEIIAITLGTVASSALAVQIGVLVGIAVLMTVGVYGIVAGIVKIDDLGLHLSRKPGSGAQRAGELILRAAPWLMKFLSVAGTAAMFLVGGSILAHGVPPLQHAIEGWAESAGALKWLVSMLLDAVVGIVAGAVVLGGVTLAQRMFGRKAVA
jgi:predicted DNA repair protein MutK